MHNIFCFTDIHGKYNLFRAIMDYCKEQDEEATIVFCGDACDRGKGGFQIMRELLDDPKVIYLKGNHEDMFCKAARKIKKMFGFQEPNRSNVRKLLKACRNFDYKYAAIQDSLGNGGIDTLTDWIMNGMDMKIIERLEKLPYTFSYEKIDFCHAAGIYKTFKEAADAEYKGEEVYEYTGYDLIWNRSSLDYGWEPDRTVIFGHTPVPYLFDEDDVIGDVRPCAYVGTMDPDMTGVKIDMDTGAVFLGRAYVLNVLTMKAQGFEIKDNGVEKIECIQMLV